MLFVALSKKINSSSFKPTGLKHFAAENTQNTRNTRNLFSFCLDYSVPGGTHTHTNGMVKIKFGKRSMILLVNKQKFGYSGNGWRQKQI